MAEKSIYPPTYIKPGEGKRIIADNGEMEILAVYDERVLDFFVAYYKMEKLAESAMQVSNANLEAASRATARAWNNLPLSTMKKVMEHMEPGQIWVPDEPKGGTDA